MVTKHMNLKGSNSTYDGSQGDLSYLPPSPKQVSSEVQPTEFSEADTLLRINRISALVMETESRSSTYNKLFLWKH